MTKLGTKAVATLVTVGILAAACLSFVSYETWRSRRIENLNPGTTKAAVARAVGQPDWVSDKPEGFFFNCATDRITECWIYHARWGSNHSVCFDASGRLVCVAEYFIWAK